MYEMEGPRLARAALAASFPAAVRHGAATGRVPRRRVSGFPASEVPFPVPRRRSRWASPPPGVASGMGTSSVVK